MRGLISILCLTLALAGVGLEARAGEAVPLEYQVKAAFIFNFSKFVEWPSRVFPAARTPFTIGVLGENPFGSALEEVIRNETLNGRPIAIQYSANVETLKTCQILFVSSSEKGSLPAILDQLKGTSILTVSDMEGFAQNGGMIHFLKKQDTIRFEINRAAAERANLKISAKLLSLAQIVAIASDDAGKAGQ